MFWRTRRRIDGLHGTTDSIIIIDLRRTGYSRLKKPWLSEATETISEISVKLPSQFLMTKIDTSFDKNFDSFEAETFEPEPTFENIIN